MKGVLCTVYGAQVYLTSHFPICIFCCGKGIRGHLYFGVSVSVSVEKVYFCHNFRAVRDRTFMFLMYFYLMKSFPIGNTKNSWFRICHYQGHACFANTHSFYAPCLKGPRGASSNEIVYPLIWVFVCSIVPNVYPLIWVFVCSIVYPLIWVFVCSIVPNVYPLIWVFVCCLSLDMSVCMFYCP